MTGKEKAGRQGADYVESGTVVGLGTGSTVYYTLVRLAERISEEGLQFTGVPTSEQTAMQARQLGIPLTTLDENPELALTIDGADEVDPGFNLIKGGGGALFREKVVASASGELIIVVDEGKAVPLLGEKFRLPVEVLPFGWKVVHKKLEALGCVAEMRDGKKDPFLTDNGNLIFDCKFEGIPDPAELERKIAHIPGAVESGLFVGLATKVVIGYESGNHEVTERP